MNTMNERSGTIKGHFWVELADGRKIDPYFKYYDALKHIKSLGGENKYRACDMDIQREEINKTIIPYMIAIRKIDDGDTERYLKQIANQGDNMDMNSIKYEAGCCHINAIINKIIYGKDAKIVYGDLGWKKNGSDKIYYEYEHHWDGKVAEISTEKVLERLLIRPDYFKLIMDGHTRTNLNNLKLNLVN